MRKADFLLSAVLTGLLCCAARAASISLLTPNGGEKLAAGSICDITWQSEGAIENVLIEYSADSGQSWGDVNTVGNSGSHQWIAASLNSKDCLVRISDVADANIMDTSDSVFMIFVCQLSSRADLDGNCKVDFKDMAIMGTGWLRNGNPFDPDFSEAPDGMVFIPGGTFQMGDPCSEGASDELPVHTVTLDSFYIGRHEITNSEYCAFLNSAGQQGLITVSDGAVYKAGSGTSYPYCDTSTSSSYSQIDLSGGVFSVRNKGGRDMSNDPMVQVSWYGSAAYCNRRSQEEGREQCYNLSTWACDFNKKGYRLATEAQWECAARGGLLGKRFPWGGTITHSEANYYSNSSYSYDISQTRGYHPTWSRDGIYPYTSPLGSFAADGYGLYDMAGNVWEWCNDWYLSTYYSSSPVHNPTGPTSGSYRVLRGGSWSNYANFCRTSFRDTGNPSYMGYSRGFRLCLDLN